MQGKIAGLQQLADSLSEPDLVLALMIVARNNLFVRPIFSQYSDIIIKDATGSRTVFPGTVYTERFVHVQ